LKDQRAQALAEVLVRYSTEVSEGDVCIVRADTAAEPLALAVYEEVLRAGGLPMVVLQMEEQEASLLRLASDAQLDWVPPPAHWSAEQADALIELRAETNTRALSGADPGRQARRGMAFLPIMETVMKRAAAGEVHRCTTLFPTQAYAAEAEMSLAEYEEFYYGACLCDRADPVSSWREQADGVQRAAEWMSGKEEVRVEGPGVDLQLNVSGRTFVAGTGKQNMPDGEFFTGPIEDSASGEINFSYPASFGGREVAGVRLRFKDGRVVDASAERNEEYLLQMLDSDDGARRLGEFGVGANYNIGRFTGDILLDEKIGGTIHLALGMSYPETGGHNHSAIHWDMICDLRHGGRIEVDGADLQVDGKFLV
jgi:aminopeptidase